MAETQIKGYIYMALMVFLLQSSSGYPLFNTDSSLILKNRSRV